MGNSIQEYRVQIGLYNGSIKCFKFKSPGYKSRNNKYRKSKPNMKVSAAELLIFFGVFCIFSLVHSQRSELIVQKFHQTGCSGILRRDCFILNKSAYIEDFNFLARYTHGNIRGSGLRLCHWNKGGSYLVNSKNEIEQIIDKYRPHILGISESNFYSRHCIDDVKIDNYDLYLADTLKNPDLNVSRVAVYAHKDVVVEVRNDLKTDDVSSIWFEVGLKRQKSFSFQISIENGNI